MRWKLFVEFCLTVSVICILAGDLFLPQPYRANSQKLKVNLHNFISRIIPRKDTINFQTKTDLDS